MGEAAPPWQAVCADAEARHGLVTLEQLRRAGVSDRTRARRIRSGQLVRMAPGVFRFGGAPVTWRTGVAAACLSAGPGAVASHRTAAAVWGLEAFDPPWTVDITVPRPRRLAPRPGVRVHEARDLHLAGVTVRDGIRVTGLPRTILDVAATTRNPDIALRALDSARRPPHRVPWSALREALVLHARRGRRGVVLYREILERRAMKPPPGGEFPALVLKLLVDAGLPEPECEHWVTVRGRRYRLDLAYPCWKIGGECDGKLGHDNERAFEEDPIRDNALQLDGWLMLHFTWARLVRDPAEIVAEVRAAIRARSSSAA